MQIPFWKMHGAANDFILVDDRALTFPANDGVWISAMAKRRTGVGAEGVLLIQPSDVADFRMRFFNPDGGEVDMCGNGARCIARLAHELGAAPAAMAIETKAGIVRAEARPDGRVKLIMTPPHDWRMNLALEVNGQPLTVHYVNTGVPHVVVPVDDATTVDVRRVGAALRYHEAFAPEGTNANFIIKDDDGNLRVRTYERGVEDETLACGTGMVASALIAGRLGWLLPPVCVIPLGGDLLEVNFTATSAGASEVTFLGPAEHVFQGVLTTTP